MSARVFRGVVLVAVCFLFVPCLFGQGTDLGTIRGTVTDASGAVVPKANVTVTDLKTNGERSTNTNTDGAYEVFGLNSGSYTVTVAASGFQAKKITIVVQGGAVVGANVVLTVSAKSETVVVTAEAAQINTEDQTITQTLTSQSVIDLPRDSRDVYSFLYLNPNITQGSDAGEFKFIGAQSYGANFTVDGQRSNGGIFGNATSSQPSLDAVGEINVMSNDFSAEYGGISNIRVTTKRGGAKFHGTMFYENKNSALAAWTVQDKVNKANFQPNAFQSKYPTPYFNYNVLGASLGGPIPVLKNTWFLMAYERDYTASPLNLLTSSLPHPSLLGGDFSLVPDANKPAVPQDILDVMTPEEIANDTVPLPNNTDELGFIRIPTRLLNPYTQTLVNTYFPHIGMAAPIDSNGRIPDYGTLLPTLAVQDLGTLRLDHDFTNNDRVFVVYNGSASSSNSTQLVQTPYTGLGLTQTDRQNHTLSLSYTRIITPHLVNEARGGFNRQQLYRHSNTTLESFLSSLGLTGDQIAAYGAVVGPGELGTHGHAAVSFSGTFATFNNGGRNTDRPMHQKLATFGDTLTWIRGKHSLRFGGDAVRNAAVDGFAVNRGNVRGLMTYAPGSDSEDNPLPKITALSNFLLGEAPASVTFVQQPRPPMNVHNWETGFFAQDDWKLTPRLTVNLGIRYEVSTPFVDANDIMVDFDPNFVDAETGQKGRFVVPSSKTIQYLSPAVVNYGVVTAAQSGLGVGAGLIRQSWDKIAPRLGVAWSLNDKTVLRGGWGLYYPTSAAQGIRDPLATNTFNQIVTKRPAGDGSNPISRWPSSGSDVTSPLTGGVYPTFGNQPVASVVDFKLRDPRVHQYNVTLEREIGWKSVVRASYLGSVMHRLIATKDLDALQPSDIPIGVHTEEGGICDPNNFDCVFSPEDLARIPFPNAPDGLTMFGNFGHGRSDAFQMEFNRRAGSGLMFSASYTYLDQKSAPSDSGNSSLGSSAYNLFEPEKDYGVDSFVSHHRFVAYGTYDLPVGRGHKFGSDVPKWLNVIAGGWQTSFNMFAKSGTYFTPYMTCNNCDPVEPGNIATSNIDAVGDFQNFSYRPVVLDGNYKRRVGNQIWNPASFGPPPIGADLFSNPAVAKRNLLQGPGAWGVNLGLHKQFRFGERLAVLFGADIDNLFNHPLFMPNSDFAGGGGSLAFVGDFDMAVDQTTGQLLPITSVNPNPDFGVLNTTFSQEGVDSRRTVRVRLRITF